jgi:hypothetical protein
MVLHRVRPAGRVGLVVDKEHHFGVESQAWVEHVVLLRVILQLLQELAVAGRGHGHRGRAAVQQGTAVGPQVLCGGIGLVEHRPHGQRAAQELRVPDLLALVGQHDDETARVAQPQAVHAAGIQKGRSRQAAVLDQGLFGFGAGRNDEVRVDL